MRGCVQCAYANYCVRHTRIRLVHDRQRLQRCMWINEFVVGHYRPLRLPPSLCLRSALQWNNETVNIWSHLIGLVYLTAFQLEINLYSLPSIDASLTDHAVMAGSVLCSQICMLLSTTYHLFGCHSVRWRQRLLRLDLFGISMALTGIYLAGLYTSFYNHPTHRQAYMGATSVALAVVCYWAPRGARLRAPCRRDTLHSRLGLMEAVFATIAALGVLPAAHWVMLHGGIDSPHVIRWLPSLLILFLLLGTGFAFYATLLPERLLPGCFDVLLSSHQLWHIFVLAAIIYWHRKGVEMLHCHHLMRESMLGNFSTATQFNRPVSVGASAQQSMGGNNSTMEIF